MVDVLRQQLAELMEEELGEKKKSSISFTHHTVCRPYLMECCPSDLLLNTKIDRGCKEEHDPKLKKEYEEAREKEGKDIWHIEEDTYRILRKYVSDCDMRIRQMESQQKKESLNDVENEKVIEISSQIDELNKRAESLGEEGKIEESIQLIKQADGLRKLREEVKASQATPTSHLMKFRVCEICGASLVKENMDSRLADHFAGRLHNGYRVMREKMAWIDNERKRVQDEEREQRRNIEREREREREKERGKRRDDSHNHHSNSYSHSHSHSHSHRSSDGGRERDGHGHSHSHRKDKHRSRYEDSEEEGRVSDDDEEEEYDKKKRKREKEKKRKEEESSDEKSAKDEKKKKKRKKDDDDDD